MPPSNIYIRDIFFIGIFRRVGRSTEKNFFDIYIVQEFGRN